MDNKHPNTPADNSIPEHPDAEPVLPVDTEEQEDRQARKLLQENIVNIDVKNSEIQKWKEEIGKSKDELASWEGPHHKEIWQKKAEELHAMSQKLSQLNGQLVRLQEQQGVMKAWIPFLFEKQQIGREIIDDRDLAHAVWYPNEDGREYSAPQKEAMVIARTMGKKGYEYEMINEDGTFSSIESESSIVAKKEEEQKEREGESERTVIFAINSPEEEWPRRISEITKDPKAFEDLLKFCTQDTLDEKLWPMQWRQATRFQAVTLIELEKTLPDPRVVKIYAQYASGECKNGRVFIPLARQRFRKAVETCRAANVPLSDEIRAEAASIPAVDDPWSRAIWEERLKPGKENIPLKDLLTPELLNHVPDHDALQIERMRELERVMKSTILKDVMVAKNEREQELKLRPKASKKIVVFDAAHLRARFAVEFQGYPPDIQELFIEMILSELDEEFAESLGIKFEHQTQIAPRPPEVPDAGNAPRPPAAPADKGVAAKDVPAAKPVDKQSGKREESKKLTDIKDAEIHAKPVEEVMHEAVLITDSTGQPALQGFVGGFMLIVPVDHTQPPYIVEKDGEHRPLSEPTVEGLNEALLQSTEEEIWEEAAEEKPLKPYGDHREEILTSVFGLDLSEEVIDQEQAKNVIDAIRLIHRNAGENLPEGMHPLRALGMINVENKINPERADQFQELFKYHLWEIQGWTFEDLMALTRLWDRSGKYEFATLIQLKEQGCYKA